MSNDNFVSFEEFKELHKPQRKLGQSDKKKIDDMVNKIRAKVVENETI